MTKLDRPACTNIRCTAMTWEADLVFAAAAPYFQGHFPECPVLPGVIQIGIARALAEEWLGVSVALTAVKKVKFTHVIVPGQSVHLALMRRGDHEVSYEYRRGTESCSSGVLYF